MDFFEAQERARGRTKRLVFLFALAVLGTVLVGYAGSMFALNFRGNFNSRHSRYYEEPQPAVTLRSWWDPKIFLWTAGSTLVVVAIASLYKWSQMRAGGSAVAEMVGGRAVDLRTTDLRERRLLNVVEEMSIASGIPMPAVYILDEEPGLNAFAAGLTTSDAAVAVTRGTLDKLSRDELQGVIGHEFSHILNGDMRLNVRITAIVFGILVIGLIGRGLIREIFRGRIRGGGKKGNAVPALLVIGVALLIIGYVGYFFGRLIQAAVSRQREFLADASAVQFTRNPASISGALKKIGGYALGSAVINSHAGEIGHFFYAQAFKSNFGGLWATHPPLDERIKAVEPTWDGQMFDVPEAVDIERESFATAGFSGGQRYAAQETHQRVLEAPADLPPPLPQTRLKFTPSSVVADVGSLTDSHFRHAQALLASIPSLLRDSTRDSNSAQALVCGLLLNGDKAARDAQQLLIEKHASPAIAAAVKILRPSLSVLDPAARLPLLQLAVPALRQLEATALDRFATTLDELVHTDGIVTPYEFALQKMLLNQLRLAQAPAQRVQFDSFAAVHHEISIVLSALARVGGATQAASAFLAGAAQLPVIATQLTLLAATECGLEQVDAALDKLATCSLPMKQQLLVAAGHVIGHDGSVTLEEGDLFRALAATLGCPMPTLADGTAA